MEAAQTLALMIAGVIGVPVINQIKAWFKITDKPVLWVAYLTSLVIAILAVWASGTPIASIFADPEIIFGGSGIVFGVTQLVFRTLKQDK